MDSNANHLDGIRLLIDHLGDYYDKIINGEIDWMELLEQHMSPEAAALLYNTKEGDD